MDNLLEIKNLNKAIGSLKLTDINLTLEPGYIMGLIGRNGAGKTSLISMPEITRILKMHIWSW